MNSCVNSSTNYSPFEVVYGRRPHYPLSNPSEIDFKDLPPDTHVYLKQLHKKLEIVRNEVKANVEKSKGKMFRKANERISPLNIRVGDFVYLHEDAVGQGRKLQTNHSGPYTVDEIQSSHLIKLRDPEGKRKFRMPVQINRLKMAFIRAPEPAPYLRHTSDNDHTQLLLSLINQQCLCADRDVIFSVLFDSETI